MQRVAGQCRRALSCYWNMLITVRIAAVWGDWALKKRQTCANDGTGPLSTTTNRGTIVDNKQKGHSFCSFFNWIYESSEEEWWNSEATMASLPLESHEFHQSLELWDWMIKICLICLLSCQDMFLRAEIAIVESCLPGERKLKWIPPNATMKPASDTQA
jgi:hypothetical protein